MLAPVLFLLFSLFLVSCQSAELTELGKGDYNIETPLTHTGQEEEELHIAPSDKRGGGEKNFRSSFDFFFFFFFKPRDTRGKPE